LIQGGGASVKVTEKKRDASPHPDYLDFPSYISLISFFSLTQIASKVVYMPILFCVAELLLLPSRRPPLARYSSPVNARRRHTRSKKL
jgi:hypothetical protein